MGNFFSTDGPLFEGMAYIINIIYVSVLWILFSIPIITIGASSTALYYTVTKVIRHGRSYIFREFWQSFKSNLKQSTAVWLIYRVMMGILLVDIRVMGAFGTNSVLMAIRHLPKTLLLVVVLAAAVLGCYLFGLGIVFIPAVAALVDSLILESIFVQYMSKEDREKEALRNHPEQSEYYNRKE